MKLDCTKCCAQIYQGLRTLNHVESNAACSCSHLSVNVFSGIILIITVYTAQQMVTVGVDYSDANWLAIWKINRENVYTVFHEKGITLYTIQFSHFMVDFYTFCTTANRNKYSITQA